MIQMNSNDEDWVIDSIIQYDDLHMFELQHPTHTLEWIGEESICIGCLHPSKKTELLELRLPGKLAAGDSSLSRDRDFKVLSGGFHAEHVQSINYIPGTRSIVTSETGKNCARLWTLPCAGSDLIQLQRTMENVQPKSEAAICDVTQGTNCQVLFGTDNRDMTVCDVESGKRIFDAKGREDQSDEEVSAVMFTSHHGFVTCARRSGAITEFDTRQPASKCTRHMALDDLEASDGKTHSRSWTMALAPPSQLPDMDRDLYVINNSGRLLHKRLDNLGATVREFNLAIEEVDQDTTLSIKSCPTSNGRLSVSGSGGAVYIFDTESLEPKNSERTRLVDKRFPPSFVHKGHRACADETGTDLLRISSHAWHPKIPQLVLSSASDGSLHAWKYKAPSPGSANKT